MKKVFLVFAFAIFAATNGVAHAANNVGQCVYPKTKPAQKGRLEFKNPISIYKTPGAAEFEILKDLTSFSVKAESKGFIQLVTVPDYGQPDPDKTAGKVVGWAKLSDFKIIELRNCN
jgi:hypothetical protein